MADENKPEGEANQSTTPAATVVTPVNIAKVIQKMMSWEPEAAAVIQQLLPNDPVIQKAVSLYPTVAPALQEIAALLASMT